MDLSSLLQNKMLLQYMAGAGEALQQGQPIGPALNQITQKNIAAQSQAATNKKTLQMLRDIFNDAGSPNTPSKMTFDGSRLKYETDLAKDILGNDYQSELTLMPGSPNTSNINWPGVLNPSNSPVAGASAGQIPSMASDLTAQDLAGLSPEDVSRALTGALAVENARQDIPYKQALTKQALSAIEAKKPVYTIPGTDIGLSASEYLEWKKMSEADKTATIKNFEYAKSKGYTGDFMKFQDAAKTSHEKDYERAVAEGYEGSFNQWLLGITKAGAINIGELVNKEKSLIDIRDKMEITTDEYFRKLEKEAANDDSIAQYGFGTPEADIAVKRMALEKLDSAIRNAYRDSKVVRAKDGWYADGKLIRRNPYAK